MWERIVNGDEGLALFAAGVLAGSGWVRCRETVFVAYIDRDGGVLDCYGIECWGFDPVAVVAQDAARDRGGLVAVLVGAPAELLHISITGRLDGNGPERANGHVAASARALLAANLDLPGFEDAYYAAVRFGQVYCPWFGCVALDDSGRVVQGLEEYGAVFDLPMTVPAMKGVT